MRPETFACIAGLAQARSGLLLTPDQGYMLETRLAPLLRRHGAASLDALGGRLRGTRPEEAMIEAVVEALTTHETSFFRDGKPFEHLRRSLPGLAAARPAGTPLRIWSAACSTGQEAYSAAMVVLAQARLLGGRPVEILGTDIARDVLARAAEGCFSQFEVQRGLPIRLLVQHFRPQDGNWRIAPELRAIVRFQRWNLLTDPWPLGRFDVIFCRNVLLYFDPPTKARVLAALAGQLAADGVLYLGGAETVLGLTDRLVPHDAEPGAYRRPAPPS